MWSTDTLTAPPLTAPTLTTPPLTAPARTAQLAPAVPPQLAPAVGALVPRPVPPMPAVPPLLVSAPRLAPPEPQSARRGPRTQAAPLPRRRRSSCAPATTFEAALTELASQGATGVLHGPDGAVHLAEGLVVHAESARGASVGHLLHGAGRITVGDWEEAVRRDAGSPADHLFTAGLVGRAELELACLTATLDGAFDALAQHGGELRFDPVARPAFRLARPLSVLELRGAVGRRRALLDACWPSAELDSVPPAVTGAAPVRRTAVPRRRLQALLAAADGTRTAPELARLLGRSTFGTLLDVRQLAAAGLLASGRPAVLPDPPPAAVPPTAPPAGLSPPGPRPHDSSDPEVGLLLRLRAALEAL
ncbi:transcriptional regulator [Kitasatospora sp. NPDC059795]|uniref:transcriptional regulator n=1 Tax=Kitasatospora sp. NPDC059795 TaxID=3346949 RepID=UPI00365B5A5C